MNTGLFSGAVGHLHLSGKILRPLRFAVASLLDNSAILNTFRSLFDRLAGMKLVTYGLAFLFFSLFSSVTFVFRFMAEKEPSLADIVISAVFLLIGICLVASREHLSSALCRSRITSFLLFRILGVNEEYFKRVPHTSGGTFVSSVIGILLGLSTVVIPPMMIPIGVFACIAALLVYKIPEAGIVCAMFFAPFLPTMVMVAMMMFILICFFIKFFRGKRVIRVGWLDLCVLCFMAVMLCAGLFSANPSGSVFPVLVYLCFMCGYLLCVNLIRSAEWIRRCLLALLSAGVLVALYGIYQNFFASVQTTWQDTSMFADIQGRVVSTLENPNVLAEYLIMLLPTAIACALLAQKPRQRLVMLFVSGVLGACLIFTWSRGAWLGFLIAMMLFLLMYSKKILVIGLFGVLAIPFLPFILPDSITNRFLSIGNLGDTSTSYRVHIWEGVLNMLGDHFLGGIGVGSEAFAEIYPRYALSGIETAPHSHNLYLQITAETGILGIFLFLFFLFVYAKRNFTFYAKPYPHTPRTVVAALFCGILAVLAQGMTDYIWYNYRVFLVFWLVIGLGAAICQTTEDDNRTNPITSEKNTSQSATLAPDASKR